MSEKSNNPVVQIAVTLGGFIFVSVLMFLIFASHHIMHVGWVVIPLVVMGIAMAAMATKKTEPNQRVEPTLKAPVDSGDEQGMAGHP